MTDPLAPIVRRQRQDVNVLFGTLAESIANTVSRQVVADRPVTELDRVVIMREVDRALDVIWGRFPGDPNAAIRQIVLRDTTAVRFAPLDDAVRRWRKAMGLELRARVEAEAQG